MNRVQEQYRQDNWRFDKFIGNREAILKARQMGFSTLIAAKMFVDTINTPNTQSIIIAQDEENSKRIFGMIRRFYENLKPLHKRPAKTESSTALYWADIDSMFFVGWAGSKKLGRGGTVNNVHASEIGFWESAEDLVLGLFNSVPTDGNIFLESTANGVDNYFYREFSAAMNKQSAYSARFYPWYSDDGYTADKLIIGEEFEPEEEEQTLKGLYSLTDGQLIWRRNQILAGRNAFLSGDDSQKPFQQEYPSNWKEAFITTGVSYFDKKFIINTLMPKISPPLVREAPNTYKGLARLSVQLSGRLSVWKMPVAGRRYILTADPSEGLNTNNDLDYCSSSVIDTNSWEQVATLYGRWEPNEYAHLLAELGSWFNYALIVVLRMNHGHSVLNTLINEIGYQGQNDWGGVYYHVEYDQKNKKSLSKPGYPENVKTKGIMLSDLSEMAHDESLLINSENHLDEMIMFTKLPGGKFGASVGHDDRVIDLAVGAAVLKDSKFQRRTSRNKKPVGKIKAALGNRGGML